MIDYNGGSLAFVGDAYLTLLVRCYLLECGLTNGKNWLKWSNRFVSAVSQAQFCDYLLIKEFLCEDELVYYRRGYNYKNKSMAKNSDIVSYKKATGLESLFGYLYLRKDFDRLNLIWEEYRKFVEDNYGRICLR